MANFQRQGNKNKKIQHKIDFIFKKGTLSIVGVTMSEQSNIQ
jgi:hypothetical protein